MILMDLVVKTQPSTQCRLPSTCAGAQALGICDYGVRVGAAANLLTIAASCVSEAVAAHPPRKLVLFDGKVVARDGSFLATHLDHGRGLNVKAQSGRAKAHLNRKVGGMISAAPRPAQSNPGTFSIARRCAICSRALASA